jgi:hypothetical protein
VQKPWKGCLGRCAPALGVLGQSGSKRYFGAPAGSARSFPQSAWKEPGRNLWQAVWWSTLGGKIPREHPAHPPATPRCGRKGLSEGTKPGNRGPAQRLFAFGWMAERREKR